LSAAQALPAPGEPFAPKLHRQKIGQQARMAAVAIRERVNLHQPVMQA
jgi:hypothetical protein